MTHPLWAPWRMDYILGPKPDSCVLCLPPDDLSHDEERLKQCTTILREFFKPQGINVGLNLGEAAGAGIRDHLHFHLVPRWNGDSSFMAVMSETRVIPDHLASTYTKLKPLFARLRPGQPA